ncbi:MAG: OmpA family protein [Pseudobdellovibrionaceae bacterium]
MSLNNNGSLLTLFITFAMTLSLGACASHEREEDGEFVRVESQNRPTPAITTATEDLRHSTKFNTLAEHVRFPYASAALTPTTKLALNEIADEMKKTESSYNKIRIVGHTDPSGHNDRNQRLAQARAERAKDYLISRGVPSEKIEAIGKGPLKATGETSLQQARARRVDFEIIE